jgi:cholest-4-en-3-one 26-monooxygenase
MTRSVVDVEARPDIDFHDLDRFPRECREWFRWLRHHEPISFHPGPPIQPDHPGFWSIVLHEDLARVHRDWRHFSSEGADGPGSETGGDAIRDMSRADGVGTMMIVTDPPKHTAYRKLVNRGFTPRSIAALEPRLRAVTQAAIDAVAHRGECDFVQELAAMVPLQAIGELLGVPEDERAQLVEWTNAIASPEGDNPYAVQAALLDAKRQLLAYAADLCGRKRAHPGDDLASRMLATEVALSDGSTHQLSDAEFEMFMLLLIFGGNETTRSAIAGGILAFSEHPDQWDRLRRDPGLVPSAVEEILRFTSPVASMRRTVTAEVELRGVRLKKGDRVVMWYPAANRDESVFGPTAEQFDVGRRPNDHQAFGAGGPHFCLGAWLARLEIRLMLEELLTRLPDIHVIGPPTWARSNLILGPIHLPVAFTPQRV